MHVCNVHIRWEQQPPTWRTYGVETSVAPLLHVFFRRFGPASREKRREICFDDGGWLALGKA